MIKKILIALFIAILVLWGIVLTAGIISHYDLFNTDKGKRYWSDGTRMPDSYVLLDYEQHDPKSVLNYMHHLQPKRRR